MKYLAEIGPSPITPKVERDYRRFLAWAYYDKAKEILREVAWKWLKAEVRYAWSKLRGRYWTYTYEVRTKPRFSFGDEGGGENLWIVGPHEQSQGFGFVAYVPGVSNNRLDDKYVLQRRIRTGMRGEVQPA